MQFRSDQLTEADVESNFTQLQQQCVVLPFYILRMACSTENP